MQVSDERITAGDAVRIQDADGEWWLATADSPIEPPHRDGRKIHDFPVIWVRHNGGRRLPWPATHVQRIT
jgi:hypothetical protein